MFDTILLPTDGSEGAERAAEHARTLAEVFDATVHVVNVVDVRQYGSTRGETGDPDIARGDPDTTRKEALERRGREAIERSEAVLGDDVTVETSLLYGIPHEEVLDYADENDVALVVMGTHGRTGLDRLLVGSTTERVVRLADRPVFTVGPDAQSRDSYDEILVPTDGSSGVESAIDYALGVAEAFDATVHGLFVADVRSFMSEGDDYEVSVPDAALDSLEEQGEAATAYVAEQATSRGPDAETDVVDGIPTGAILEYAADHDMDLVVMGTHGRTGLGRLLLGSVAETVVRKADCPVLTVRRTDDEE
jgi:nucleotide-binding universal stress UspA family protein